MTLTSHGTSEAGFEPGTPRHQNKSTNRRSYDLSITPWCFGIYANSLTNKNTTVWNNAHEPLRIWDHTKQPPKGFKRLVKLVYLFNPYPDGR